MPWAAFRHCPAGHPPFTGKRCPRCASLAKAKADQQRSSARERGYDSKWTKESKAFLALPENRLCACGCNQPAEVVDHIIPHKGDMRLFWNHSNWQPLTKACNTRKAIRTEGGFGRPQGQGRNLPQPDRDRRGHLARNIPENGTFR